MKNKRIVYMGTPEFSAVILDAIISAGYHVVGVVTQMDKKVGRKQEVVYSKVKEVAIKYDIPVLQPYRIKEEYQEILDLDPELILTCAYGQIVPDELLAYPKHHCINIHASLLPKYRGGAPIHYAIYHGDKETGVSIMEMVSKMDAGAVCYVKKHSIAPHTTTSQLFEQLSVVGKEAILECLDDILSDNVQFKQQDENLVTYAPTIKKSQELLDLNQSVMQVEQHIRSLSDMPGAYFMWNNKKVKLFDVTYTLKQHQKFGQIEYHHKQFHFYLNDGILHVNTLQMEGKVKMDAVAFYNGYGKQFTQF